MQTIVQMFIMHASPVGSRSLAKQLQREMKLSPATVRNVMADLEDLGYVTHPHTSAGRMPTDKGYRLYVDALMGHERISMADAEKVDDIRRSPRENMLKDASRILGSVSHHLAVVRIPKFNDVIVKRVDLIRLAADRVLVVLALESDIVQTITIETGAIPTSNTLTEVNTYLNERLSGRPLRVLNEIFPEAMSDSTDPEPSLVRLFVEQVGRLNSTNAMQTVHVSGAQQLLSHPEFGDPERMRSVIELMENEDMIIHVVDNATAEEGVNIRIGNELDTEEMMDYSLVTTTYRVGSAKGSVSLIGPKRMQYSRMISLVQMVSDTLNDNLSSQGS